MSKSFIHGIWGVYKHQDNHWYTRRPKIDNDMKLELLNPYAPPTKVYVFGKDNYKRIIDMGFDESTVVMVDKKPCVFNMETEQYRHKIEVWKCGLEEFDEIVFLDWDCVPIHQIPNNFWNVMAQGEKIQATLYMYTIRRAHWRTGDTRKLSASTFVYVRNKKIVNDIIKVWEENGRLWQEEIALSKYIDEINGGWHGIEKYKKYEPKYHNLFWYFDPDFLETKIPLFFHYNKNKVKFILGNGKNVKSRLDYMYEKEISDLKKIIQEQREKINLESSL